ncbi:hypothetical protein DB30_01314 [Enhygromyxa salina]|uniref:CARDB domain-containing protein n=1 Tax=Enhygromyxa salina TaxID=215803 RepID=A0A0C2CXC1_9BACT|nr:CARDB domain-containing protein [Enhygromyxa salina]KIG12497.1 hypothetical protein DB30_01314 [Enhygromyxa salina]
MMTKTIASLVAACTLLLPATALAAPDLIVSDINASYDDVTDLVTFKIIVKNIGPDAAVNSFWVDMWAAEDADWATCSDVDWDWGSVSAGLGSGGSAKVYLEMPRSYTMGDPIAFFVDVDQRVVEADETNNEGQALVMVSDPSEPRVAIGSTTENNSECLQDAVFDALGVVIPGWAQVFFAKLRVIQ